MRGSIFSTSAGENTSSISELSRRLPGTRASRQLNSSRALHVRPGNATLIAMIHPRGHNSYRGLPSAEAAADTTQIAPAHHKAAIAPPSILTAIVTPL